MNKSSNQQNILISACLLGSSVRYNGTDLLLDHPLLKQWKKEGRLISVCPEVAGGLPTPRAPAEIMGGDGLTVLSGKTKVINKNGEDVTKAFKEGANKALRIAKENNCIAAILTERSPSCGSSMIYDGSFSGVKKIGGGVTTMLLQNNGIQVFSQYQLKKLHAYISNN